MKDIFEMYKAGDIVYPSAVARFYKEPICKAYDKCNTRVNKDLRRMYMVRCPHCNYIADYKRYYAVVDVPKEKITLLFVMIFGHIVDDYYLQGILASMKQKSWWKENAPDKMYEKDYLAALFMHSFSWAFMVMFMPVVLFHYNVTASVLLFIFFAVNVAVHMIVDDLKANKKKINLITDQSIHMAQILITWLVCYMR